MSDNLKEQLSKILADLTGNDEVQVTIANDQEHGDLSTNIPLIMAAKQKQPPLVLAQKLVDSLVKNEFIKKYFSKVEAVKPGFINFFYSHDYLRDELAEIIKNKDYGRQDIGQAKTVVVEYSSPNTNKPLHVGHLRNNALGMALANIFKFLGYKVVKTEVINDRGIHIMKSLLAYLKWGQNQIPKKLGVKGDKFVGDFYVKYNQAAKDNPDILVEARELLRQWEAKDKKIRKLWRQMNGWVYQGWRQTYKIYGSEFDIDYFESDLYDKGREIIIQAEKRGLVHKNSAGAVVIDLSQYGLGSRDSGEKVLLRPDGTTVYMTQDIYLASQRWDDYKFEQMFYVVGDEQVYHFQVLFRLLDILGYDWYKRCYHYAHGQVLLPEGKMKSREGKVVDADDLIEELSGIAIREVEKRRDNLSKKDTEKIAKEVATSAIKYWFLKSNPKTVIHFNPKESLDFEGNTGPYLLYTYVRLHSILSKVNSVKLPDVGSFGLEEKVLIRLMCQWPFVIKDFVDHYSPNVVCEYLYKLASSLNGYYQSVPVLKAGTDVRRMRLQVILAGSQILKTGLELLNIKTLEKM